MKHLTIKNIHNRLAKKIIMVAAALAFTAVLITGLANNLPGHASTEQLSFFDSFETDASAWVGSGTATRVASGTNGITASEGDHYVVVDASPGTRGPNTQLGGYGSVWPGDWKSSIDMYLDPSWDVGEGIVYSVAVNKVTGTYHRDFSFHAGVVQNEHTNNQKVLAVTADPQSAPVDDPLDTLEHLVANGRSGVITQAGWYTVQHEFRNLDGRLVVKVSVSDTAKNEIFSYLIDVSSPDYAYGSFDDTIEGVIGGNRYGWFTNIAVDGGLAVDNLKRINTSNAYSVDPNGTEPINVELEEGKTVTFYGAEAGEFTAPVQVAISNQSVGANVIIPAGTTITAASSDWDGVMIAPTPRKIDAVTVNGQDSQVSAAVRFGSLTTPLQFSQPVKVVLAGQAGQKAGYIGHDDEFVAIDTACGVDDPAATISGSVNECYLIDGDDLVIWTNHFSTYVAYAGAPGVPNTSTAG